MLVLTRRGRMFLQLCFMISGAVALITVQQPPVVTAPLGHDILLPCEIQDSQDEEIQTNPVLYWVDEGKHHLLNSDGKYAGRIERTNQTSSNKSIVLKNVQWSDGGTYECKLSIRTNLRGSFRLKGNNTMLIIYDTMNFNLTNHNDTLLRCEVNMSKDFDFALSVIKDGCVLQGSDSAAGRVMNRGIVTLSQTVSLRGGGKYECQLQLRDDLITTSSFYSKPTAAGEDGKNATAACSPVISNLEQYPEPWFLYVSLLLVPILFLLTLTTCMLMRRGFLAERFNKTIF
ncbi:hypothetical protein CRENBAI_011771 [Crenichthys baileyi]|uniref:Ig-like domain-containing protein n=1 Tax=Crenichthys baileyi TaxID=28760 RepID=A0AAV9RYK3_9TELE